jgi:predicted transcriptional regulator
MSATCESIARHILPLYRSLVARELVEKHKYTQVKAAKKLGTTQAAISQYVTSKRGRRGIPNYEAIFPLVHETAAKIAERMVISGIGPEEFSGSFCELCRELRRTRKIK